MDRRFFKYIKEKKDALKIGIVLSLGLILVFLGTRSEGKVSAESTVGIEERISQACSNVAGVGKCEVFIYYAPADSKIKESEVESVLVICEGADSVEIRLRLTEILSSVFGIGTNRVRIEKMRS